MTDVMSLADSLDLGLAMRHWNLDDKHEAIYHGAQWAFLATDPLDPALRPRAKALVQHFRAMGEGMGVEPDWVTALVATAVMDVIETLHPTGPNHG